VPLKHGLHKQQPDRPQILVIAFGLISIFCNIHWDQTSEQHSSIVRWRIWKSLDKWNSLFMNLLWVGTGPGVLYITMGRWQREDWSNCRKELRRVAPSPSVSRESSFSLILFIKVCSWKMSVCVWEHMFVLDGPEIVLRL
jgi:hypothetical protein